MVNQTLTSGLNFAWEALITLISVEVTHQTRHPKIVSFHFVFSLVIFLLLLLGFVPSVFGCLPPLAIVFLPILNHEVLILFCVHALAKLLFLILNPLQAFPLQIVF